MIDKLYENNLWCVFKKRMFVNIEVCLILKINRIFLCILSRERMLI